jgi:hypothetical protein
VFLRCLTVLAGLTALALTGGCGEPTVLPVSPASSTTGRTVAPASSSSGEDWSLALSVLETTPRSLRDDAALSAAEQLLIGECMRGYRLAYVAGDRSVPADVVPTDTGTLTVDVRPSSRVTGYGVVADVLALRHSLGVRPERGMRPNEPNPNDRHLRSLGPREAETYQRRLSGTPQGVRTLRLWSGVTARYQADGCLGTARARLYGSVDRAARSLVVPQDVKIMIGREVESDPSFVRALSLWQRCMRSRGHSHPRPAAVVAAVEAGYLTGVTPLTRREEATLAQADATCDVQASLRATATRIRARSLGARHIRLVEDLAAVARIRREAAPVAREILRRAPGRS